MAAPLTRRSGCLSSALFLVALIGAHAPRGSRRLRGTLINATRGTRSLVEAPADRRRLANYQEVAKLTAADAAANDWFGYSVAIDGTPSCGCPLRKQQKKVRLVFRTSGGATSSRWPSRRPPTPRRTTFGVSVAIDGDTVVVGAYWDDDGGTNSGSPWRLPTTDGGRRRPGGQTDGRRHCFVRPLRRLRGDDGSTVVVGAYYKNSYRG